MFRRVNLPAPVWAQILCRAHVGQNLAKTFLDFSGSAKQFSDHDCLLSESVHPVLFPDDGRAGYETDKQTSTWAAWADIFDAQLQGSQICSAGLQVLLDVICHLDDYVNVQCPKSNIDVYVNQANGQGGGQRLVKCQGSGAGSSLG